MTSKTTRIRVRHRSTDPRAPAILSHVRNHAGTPRGGRIKAELAHWWGGAWLRWRREPEWMSRRRDAAVNLWLLLTCLLLAFAFAIVATAIIATLAS
jgi:hypothetical protein